MALKVESITSAVSKVTFNRDILMSEKTEVIFVDASSNQFTIAPNTKGELAFSGTMIFDNTVLFDQIPTCGTATTNDNSNQLATTAFVQTAIAGVSGVSLIADNTFTGVNTFNQSPIVPTLLVGDDTTKVVNSSFLQTTLAGYVNAQNVDQAIQGIKSFVGNTIALTQAAGNSSYRLANTAFVANAISDFVTLSTSQTITADKAFTGNTTAVTQAISDDSQRISTTAYVKALLNSVAASFPTLAGTQTFTGTNTFNSNIVLGSSAHISLGLSSTTTSVPATFYLGSTVTAAQTGSGSLTTGVSFPISTLTLSAGGNYILQAAVTASLSAATTSFILQIGTTNGGSQLGFISVDAPTTRCFNVSGMQMGTIGRNIYLSCTATFASGSSVVTTANFRFQSIRIG